MKCKSMKENVYFDYKTDRYVLKQITIKKVATG